jgi:hypothetical protein
MAKLSFLQQRMHCFSALRPDAGAASISETSVNVYHITRRSNPENSHLQPSLKIFRFEGREGVGLPACEDI